VDSLDAKTLSDAVKQKLFGLQQLVTDFETVLIHPTCEQFIKGIRLLLEAVEESHQQWLDELPSGPEGEEHVKTVSKICLSILANIHSEFLPYLDSSAQQTSYLLLPTLTKAVDTFRGDATVELALVPQFEYTYGIAGLPQFAKLEINKLDYTDEKKKTARLAAAAALPSWTAFVSYPMVEKNSALNLAVVSHELAHLVDFIKELYKPLVPQKLDEEAFKKLIEEASTALEAAGFQVGPQLKDRIEAEYYKDCVQMVVSWLKEVIADIIALRVLGPAYLFSFLEFLAHGAFENQHDSEHPAPARRLKLLIDELSSMNYFKVDTGVTKQLQAIKTRVSDEAKTTVYQQHALVADKTLETTLDSLLTNLRKFCSSISYTAERYRDEVPPVVRLIQQGIAPIETCSAEPKAVRTPSPVVAVLNAGWEVYKVGADEFSKLFEEDVSKSQQVVTLNHLLFKAIEAGELLREWQKTV